MKLLRITALLLVLSSYGSSFADDPQGPAAPVEERIDFQRARELFRKRQSGEQLTADEAAYLRRAMEARQQGTGGRAQTADRRQIPATDKTGLKPLTEMTAADSYLGQDGGLYGAGRNAPPEGHLKSAQLATHQIQPLNAAGKPATDGRIVLVSISMSNATQEFSRFKQLADADPDKSSRLTIVDCAQGGQAMAEWVNPQAGPWMEAARRLERSGVSPEQVQIAWIKLANKSPQGDLEAHGKKLQMDTLAVIQNAKAKFPNLRVAYLSSRIYGGHTSAALNPEPFAYESAFPVRWLIQDQMAGADALSVQSTAAHAAKAPVLLWGPYLWADGVTPREGDGLTWPRSDLGPDGTHPSPSGRNKVAGMLLTFFKTDPLARQWFVKSK